MKKKRLCFMLCVLGFSMAAACFSPSAFAAKKNTEVSAEKSVFTKGMTGTLTICYREGAQGKDAVAGAHFTLFKLAEFTSPEDQESQAGTGYRSVIPGLHIEENAEGGRTARISQVQKTGNTSSTGRTEDRNAAEEEKVITVDSDPLQFGEIVREAYKNRKPEEGKIYRGNTGQNGCLTLKEIEPAAYLLVEEQAAENHYKSVPALVSIPEMAVIAGSGQEGWNYDLTIEPKSIPAGKLRLRKKIKGNAAEKRRAFHFKFTVKSPDMQSKPAAGKTARHLYIDPETLSYPYTTSAGKSGEIRSRETLTVRPGESVEIRMLPAGTRYQITEAEADRYGYQTESRNAHGYIRKEKTVQVTFINSRSRSRGPVTGELSKPLKGIAAAAGKKVRPVSTGDPLDSRILCVLAAAAGGLVFVLAVKKRKGNTDEN